MRRILFLASLLVVSCCRETTETDYVRYVDPYIGTGGHGHVFMGASVPFGMVQLGPTSIPQSWDWTSGYHISDTTVIGFAHTHLSGTGIGDLSDIVLMPVVGQVALGRGTEEDTASGQWSYFRRANERCAPGYYATRLERYGVDVELTASERVGLHRYTFPTTNDARVVINLADGQCWDEPTESYIVQTSDTTVAGYRFSKGWAHDQRVWFTAHFSKPITRLILSNGNGTQLAADSLRGVGVFGQACFGDVGSVMVKVALSPVSIANAEANMLAEMPGWDFEAVKATARKKWNAELSKIAIKTSDKSVKRIFYTGLYHTMIAPSLFCDVNGDYRGADRKVHRGEGFTNYTTFSLWDTYRAAHPLMTIIHPERVPDMINTMLHIYKQQGKLPVWHLMGCETDCMVGNPAICVVADALLKGFEGFDRELAYEAMTRSAMLEERGLGLLKQYGYIPSDLYNEAVATCMEYAIADFALALAAQKMGRYADCKYFLHRSLSYRHYFDPSTGFMRGRLSDGSLRTPFNPFSSSHRADDFTEGNAWQYTWLAPHDVEGLVELFGSRERFISKLDSLFIATGDMGGEASPDISGLIGQYAHGNEPSHHILYLYTMVGEPCKTAERVREVLSTMYSDCPDGLSGNEDAGQMSAWYILSSLGFYQVEPAGGRYFFGSPIVDRAVLKVGDGRTFTINVSNNSSVNKYIKRIKLNGKPYDKNYISFADIAAGGTLEIEMMSAPCKNK